MLESEFLFGKQCMISPLSYQKNFTTFQHNNVDRWGDENFRYRILKILLWGVVLKKAKIAH